ncbi:hypothetical protein EYF80_008892 [Liparis tanakae]|uniref:Uncharacterized protein n=1 Tax=Liparis tanakae TaxID=230148 RepID=A0A4Z2ISZ8_9TELE|nr:hypothetical protein EYF80_008892 [Liparis tanakae]
MPCCMYCWLEPPLFANCCCCALNWAELSPAALADRPEPIWLPPGFMGLLLFAIGLPSTWVHRGEEETNGHEVCEMNEADRSGAGCCCCPAVPGSVTRRRRPSSSHHDDSKAATETHGHRHMHRMR